MAERPEDFNLPVSVVARLLKETLPEGVAVSKEARAALAKAAAIFVLYTTSLSNNFANKGKRKTVTGQDVMAAMEDMELAEFLPQLQEALEAFRKERTAKKDKKKAKETSENIEKEADDDAKDDVEMTEEPVSDADVTAREAATEES